MSYLVLTLQAAEFSVTNDNVKSSGFCTFPLRHRNNIFKYFLQIKAELASSHPFPGPIFNEDRDFSQRSTNYLVIHNQLVYCLK